MNRFAKVAPLLIAGILPFSALSAQEAATPSPSTPSAASPAAPAASSSFTDAELQKFAGAAVELNKIQGDAAVPAADKQPKMLAAVQASGLQPARFNEIAQAAQTDTALQQKIQLAAAKTAPGTAKP